ncbi:hypothetical protein [Billgrantia sp. C5P2]|uniref:hypothetical protein n=1 Tax=Billgrantia sp. C5P2 TaxID=3436239 RepID=UPI003DA5846C
MVNEVVASVLASLGGATFIVAAFAHFLGTIWTDRIARSTKARFDSELETTKAQHQLALETFKSSSSRALKEQEYFAGISASFYENFFSERVGTYLKLLELKNQYITSMEEEFLTEVHEDWGSTYHATYTKLRKLIIEKQIYVSNDLDKCFEIFRSEASRYVKDADLVEAHTYTQDEPPWENESLRTVYEKFATNTDQHMQVVMEQIGRDVAKLRARIEIDKA